MNGALLIAGTSSDAGKSVVVAGLCRFLSRRGHRVAPFKAQNMSLNSVVTPAGAEIGRAQAAQAAAAGVVPEAAMNPVLLKPTGERSSQVVVLGHARQNADALSYQGISRDLVPVVSDAFASLRSRFDIVVCEGAGSLGEFNLRSRDLTNMGFARRAGVPVVVVADIDRGGALAGLFGCLAVLDPKDQALVSGFLINKFRGDRALLDPGLERLEAMTGRPTYGVLPWSSGVSIDAEDSVALSAGRATLPALGPDVIDIAVVRLPRISNFTDFDALATEPGVAVRFVGSPAEVVRADLAVVPGTKATVDDLEWMRSRGLADALLERAHRGDPILGVCGGYQMLGRHIVDDVESRVGLVDGLGLLPIETEFRSGKVLANRVGTAAQPFGASIVSGYEIRHGRVTRFGGERVIQVGDEEEGCISGSVVGISWHGALESDSFRREFLRWISGLRRLDWVPGSHSFASLREERLDRLGDLIERCSDTDALLGLVEGGPQDLGIVDSRLICELTAKADITELRRHGDNAVSDSEGAVDFAVNVVAGGAPEWVDSELLKGLPEIGRYPDPSDAIRRLAERHDRSVDEVLPTNGAAEALWLITTALRPRRAAVVHPSFTEPEVALRSLGLPVTRVFRNEDDFHLDPSRVPDDSDLVFVCNPNNPTGTLDPIDMIQELKRPDRVVVVDEAFMDFCLSGDGSLAEQRNMQGVLVVKSATKILSVPGIRAGYLLGESDLIQTLRLVRQPWSVNSLALKVLEAIAARSEAVKARAEGVAVARDELVAGLSGVDSLHVWPSVANFVLVRLLDGRRVGKALVEHGFALRSAENFPGLTADHLRISVRLREENLDLIDALRRCIDSP